MRKTTSILVASICAISLCVAAESGEPVRKPIGIPAQALGSALKALASERDFQLVYRAEIVTGLETAGVSGELTDEDALRQLLKGTGLTWRRLDENTITIIPLAAQTSSRAVAQTDLRLAQGSQAAADDAAELTPRRTELEEIVVTGSHIRGVQASASPLLRFDREDIALSGYSTLDQFIESLPQNSGGGASQDTVGTDSAVGNNGYGNAVNLRALGPGASLVLLNGRRLAPGGNSGRFVDISMIPLSAVERVEVLTDGASAIYGSDAVGGVVNFILRKDYEGAETSARYGRVTDGGLAELQATQSLGAAWLGGGALFSYEYNQRDALDARDRDFAAGSDAPRTLLPEQKRHSAYFSAHQDIAESWSVFADALYSRRETENVLTYLDLLNEEESESEQIHAALGAEVALGGGWQGQISSSYSKHRFDASLLRTPVPNGAGELTETNVDTDVWSFDALADGALVQLPGGELRLALGASHRREDVLPIGGDDLPGRRVNAAFAELFIPFIGASNSAPGFEALELTLAGRYEDYNDFGDDVTPKYGLRWQPTGGLSLRATYGESFKAPTLTDLAPGTESLLAFVASDFGADIPGDPVILLRAQAAQPELREERSRSWTAGFDLQPASESFSLSVTYFRIEFENRIDSPISVGFTEFLTDTSVFGDFLVVNPDAAFIEARLAEATDFADLTGGLFAPDAVGLWADAAVTNIAEEEQSGVDVTFEMPFDVGRDKLSMWLNSTYLLEFEKKPAPRAEGRDVLNTLNQPIDLRLRGGVNWRRGGLTTALIANYQDSYKDVDAASSAISSWTTFDAHVRWQFDAGVASFADGLVLALSAQNLFDEDPPFVETQGSPIAHAGFDAVNATPLGRFVALELTKSW
ncbi:MAG: TonB-dependent receptor domain-containing protein [Steroidobacter sp.]